MSQETHYLIRPAGATFEDGPLRSETCRADTRASINNQCCYIVYLVGMYIYIYILQKMIHGPSNAKYINLFMYVLSFQVFTVEVLQIVLFWVLTPNSFVDGYQWSGRIFCFPLQGWNSSPQYDTAVTINPEVLRTILHSLMNWKSTIWRELYTQGVSRL